MKNKNIVQKICDYLERKEIYCDVYLGISEKGYEDIPVIMTDWNKVSVNLIDFIEKHLKPKGICDYQWEDEWMGCTNCYKAVRNINNSYFWQPSYVWVSDCEILCRECWDGFIEDVIEWYKNKPTYCVPADFRPCLEKAGFVCYSPDNYCEIFQTGLHKHMDSDPKKVIEEIQKELPDHDVIFMLNQTSQFYIEWSVLIRKREEEE